MTEETEQPVDRQQQDQRKQVNLLIKRMGAIRPEIRPDGSMKVPTAFARLRLARGAGKNKSSALLDLMQILVEAHFKNSRLPFFRLARLRIHSPIAQRPLPLRGFSNPS